MVPPWCRSARSSICSLRTLLILEGFAYFSLVCRIENLGEGISSFQEILRVVSKSVVGGYFCIMALDIYMVKVLYN